MIMSGIADCCDILSLFNMELINASIKYVHFLISVPLECVGVKIIAALQTSW